MDKEPKAADFQRRMMLADLQVRRAAHRCVHHGYCSFCDPDRPLRIIEQDRLIYHIPYIKSSMD